MAQNSPTWVPMIQAFVAHSFESPDQVKITPFTNFFNVLKKSTDYFDWEDAEENQIAAISDKVKKKIKGKNLFIGILTKRHREIED